jgi:hypothetical protein
MKFDGSRRKKESGVRREESEDAVQELLAAKEE